MMAFLIWQLAKFVDSSKDLHYAFLYSFDYKLSRADAELQQAQVELQLRAPTNWLTTIFLEAENLEVPFLCQINFDFYFLCLPSDFSPISVVTSQ